LNTINKLIIIVIIILSQRVLGENNKRTKYVVTTNISNIIHFIRDTVNVYPLTITPLNNLYYNELQGKSCEYYGVMLSVVELWT